MFCSKIKIFHLPFFLSLQVNVSLLSLSYIYVFFFSLLSVLKAKARINSNELMLLSNFQLIFLFTAANTAYFSSLLHNSPYVLFTQIVKVERFSSFTFTNPGIYDVQPTPLQSSSTYQHCLFFVLQSSIIHYFFAILLPVTFSVVTTYFHVSLSTDIVFLRTYILFQPFRLSCSRFTVAFICQQTSRNTYPGIPSPGPSKPVPVDNNVPAVNTDDTVDVPVIADLKQTRSSHLLRRHQRFSRWLRKSNHLLFLSFAYLQVSFIPIFCYAFQKFIFHFCTYWLINNFLFLILSSPHSAQEVGS